MKNQKIQQLLRVYNPSPSEEHHDNLLKRKNKSFITKIKKGEEKQADKKLLSTTTHIQLQNPLPFHKTEAQFYSQSPDPPGKELREDELVLSIVSGQPKVRRVKREVSHASHEKRNALRKSPYISNSIDIQKVLRMLNPVHGPNESLKLQIKRHNDLHIRNAENIILQRTQNFDRRMEIYSTRLGLECGVRIFVMNSKDYHIRKALLDRKWVEATDLASSFFHLKWVYMDSPQDYNKLQAGQFYNHFRNNQQLTNKNLLQKNIKKMPFRLRPSFPCSYDLEVNEDAHDFQNEYFKFEALKVFEKLVEAVRQKRANYFARVMKNRNYFRHQRKKKVRMSMASSSGRISLSLEKHKSLQVLYTEEFNRTIRRQLAPEQLEMYKNVYLLVGYLCELASAVTLADYSLFAGFREWRSEKIQILRLIHYEISYNDCEFVDNFSPFYLVEIFKLSWHLRAIFGKHYGLGNTWIIKPAGVSRGSGIAISSDLGKIVQSKYGKIVQKYIERPLILECGRKFDIRQWVLVRSFLPLEIYAFSQCYGRFSSVAYGNEDYEDLQKHLTNYSQNKQSYAKIKRSTHLKSPLSSVMAESELSRSIGERRWRRVKEEIYANIYRTISCCQHEVSQKEGCFEVYGFDVIIDSGYKPWLLEVNLSPACENREPFLGEYLSRMAEGIADMLEGSGTISGWDRISCERAKGIERGMARREEEVAAARVIVEHLRMRVEGRKRVEAMQ